MNIIITRKLKRILNSGVSPLKIVLLSAPFFMVAPDAYSEFFKDSAINSPGDEWETGDDLLEGDTSSLKSVSSKEAKEIVRNVMFNVGGNDGSSVSSLAAGRSPSANVSTSAAASDAEAGERSVRQLPPVTGGASVPPPPVAVGPAVPPPPPPPVDFLKSKQNTIVIKKADETAMPSAAPKSSSGGQKKLSKGGQASDVSFLNELSQKLAKYKKDNDDNQKPHEVSPAHAAKSVAARTNSGTEAMKNVGDMTSKAEGNGAASSSSKTLVRR